MNRMAIISAGFVPVPAVDGGAGEVLTTELIKGNEKIGDYYMDIYTIESPKLDRISYNNAEIIQIHITKWNWLVCKARNTFLKLFKRRYRYIPYNRALLKQFKDNYDMIIVENNMQVFEDIYNHSQNNSHMIYHMHNDIDGTTKPECLCELIAEKSEKIIFVSEYLKKHFNQIAPNNKSYILKNAIDMNQYCNDNIYNINLLKDKYGVGDEDFIFMYTGRVCKEKGIMELVRSFKSIIQQCPKAKLMIVGSTWYNQIDKDEYAKKVEEEIHDIRDRVITTGYIYPEEMPQIYGLANVVVIPTIIEEAFGMSALEAMAMDKPLIVTNSGGMKELVQGIGENIIVDKKTDLEYNLANAFITLYEKMIGSEEYSVRDQLSEYNINKYFDRFIEIINS